MTSSVLLIYCAFFFLCNGGLLEWDALEAAQMTAVYNSIPADELILVRI